MVMEKFRQDIREIGQMYEDTRSRRGTPEQEKEEEKRRREAYSLYKASEQIYSVVGTLETATRKTYGFRLVPAALASALAEIENDGDKEIVQVITFSGGAEDFQRLAGAVVIAKKKS
jgi:hypothetical protein